MARHGPEHAPTAIWVLRCPDHDQLFVPNRISKEYSAHEVRHSQRPFEYEHVPTVHEVRPPSRRFSKMLHVDVFPRRFDRKRIPLVYGTHLSTPRELRDYWGKCAMDAYARSKALVVLNLGAHFGRLYEK